MGSEQGEISNRRSGPLGSLPGRAAPVGVPVRTRIERSNRGPAIVPYILQITVLDVVRGPDAEEQVRKQGLSDKPVPAGLEYLLARIRFSYSCAAKVQFEVAPYIIDKRQLAATSGDGSIEFDGQSLLCEPTPRIIDMPIPEGSVKEGWIVLQLPQSEKEPLLAFYREWENKLSIQGPFWFKLYQFDPMSINGPCGECVVQGYDPDGH